MQQPEGCREDQPYCILDLGEVAWELEKEESTRRLMINTKKTKILSLTLHQALPISINGQNTMGVDLFVYLFSFAYEYVGTELYER